MYRLFNVSIKAQTFRSFGASLKFRNFNFIHSNHTETIIKVFIDWNKNFSILMKDLILKWKTIRVYEIFKVPALENKPRLNFGIFHFCCVFIVYRVYDVREKNGLSTLFFSLSSCLLSEILLNSLTWEKRTETYRRCSLRKHFSELFP